MAVVVLAGRFAAVAAQAVRQAGVVKVEGVPVAGVGMTAHAGAFVVLDRCRRQVA